MPQLGVADKTEKQVTPVLTSTILLPSVLITSTYQDLLNMCLLDNLTTSSYSVCSQIVLREVSVPTHKYNKSCFPWYINAYLLNCQTNFMKWIDIDIFKVP